MKSNRVCEGYELRLLFDVDDSRNKKRLDKLGKVTAGFVGKPKSRKVTPKKETTGDKVKAKDQQEVVKPSSNIDFQNNTSVLASVKTSSTFDNSSLDDIMNVNPAMDKFEQVGMDLYQNFEHLLNIPDLDKLLSMDYSPESIDFDTAQGVLEPVFIKKKVLDSVNIHTPDLQDSGMITSYDEENLLLKHFFQKLLPLLDAHPNSPWPDLALKYCDFDIARSCFIALACIHMYESGEAGKEYYNKGVTHINRTMNYLIRFINSINNSESSNIDKKRRHISSLVILMLIHVHVIFAIIEKGKSTLSRYLLEVFASICEDVEFCQNLMSSDKMSVIVVCLAWCDTISAILSYDCRLPFCLPTWYSSTNNVITTAKMMGCPGEIFQVIHELSKIRHELHNQKFDEDKITQSHKSIKEQLLRYRDYVKFEQEGDDFNLRLKGAQCWAIAVLVTLNRTTKYKNYEQENQKLVSEFIHVHLSMNQTSSTVTQMVWPVHVIGCESITEGDRESMVQIYDDLYKNTNMKNAAFMKEVAMKVWESKLPQEQVLEQLLADGSEYLPI